MKKPFLDLDSSRVVTILVKMTGLHFERKEGCLPNAFAMAKLTLLFIASAVRTLEKMAHSFGFFNKTLHSNETVDLVVTLQSLGSNFQSFFSLVIIICWQWEGGFLRLKRKVLTLECDGKSSYSKLKPWLYILPGAVMLSEIFMLMYIIWFSTLSVKFYVANNDYLTLSYILIYRNALVLHGVFVGHVALCIFMISMCSLTIELSTLNQEFRELIKARKYMKADKNFIESRTQALCQEYCRRRKKVSDADYIFRTYTFFMIPIWLSTTIFVPITLLRVQWSVQLVFILKRLHDALRSIVHLYGLCVYPAQLRRTHDILSIYLSEWIDPTDKFSGMIKNLSDNIAQSNIGITVGGMTVMTKPMILTCLSVILPYIVLCLQLRIGTSSGATYQ
ncbi:hypothetical protein DdX_18378 [Ditylenchus destructor]|uniref:Gustatory receptor n=1 Tax=Ditylenchus destructor TaxID=166010 RepID=A0AAD4QYC4_9BILA|nr:hypothetical protein DdX_18378 [Ditylenchus destructor]